MARIAEAAWSADVAWGLFIWLSAVTGARRGEVVALQWCDIDLDKGVVRLDENYVRGPDGMIIKDPKDHQLRYVPVDKVTVDLLRRHKADCARQLLTLGVQLTRERQTSSPRVCQTLRDIDRPASNHMPVLLDTPGRPDHYRDPFLLVTEVIWLTCWVRNSNPES